MTTPKRTRRFVVRVSPFEESLIKWAAQRERISISEYVRRTVIRRIREHEKKGEYWDGNRWIKNNAS